MCTCMRVSCVERDQELAIIRVFANSQREKETVSKRARERVTNLQVGVEDPDKETFVAGNWNNLVTTGTILTPRNITT